MSDTVNKLHRNMNTVLKLVGVLDYAPAMYITLMHNNALLFTVLIAGLLTLWVLVDESYPRGGVNE